MSRTIPTDVARLAAVLAAGNTPGPVSLSVAEDVVEQLDPGTLVTMLALLEHPVTAHRRRTARAIAERFAPTVSTPDGVTRG